MDNDFTNKKPKNEDSVYRLIRMLQLIPRSPRKTSIAAIKAELWDRHRLSVTPRTIQRDLNKLSRLFPITSDEHKPSGWSWPKDTQLSDLPQMDTLTAFSFKMVEKFLGSAMPPSATHSLKFHFKLANEILGDLQPVPHQLKEWPEKIHFLSRSQRLAPPDIKQDVLETVYESLLAEKRFNAIYRRRDEEEPIEYVVNPLGIVLLDSVIYLVCTLWKYNRIEDVRHLALHRILSAAKSEESGLVPENFSMKAYIHTGAFHYLRSEKTFRLEALFDRKVATHLYETPLSDDQVLSETDEDRIKVQATVADTSQLRWWLLGFGPQAEVLAPQFLREEFKLQAQNLADLYKKKEDA